MKSSWTSSCLQSVVVPQYYDALCQVYINIALTMWEQAAYTQSFLSPIAGVPIDYKKLIRRYKQR